MRNIRTVELGYHRNLSVYHYTPPSTLSPRLDHLVIGFVNNSTWTDNNERRYLFYIDSKVALLLLKELDLNPNHLQADLIE